MGLRIPKWVFSGSTIAVGVHSSENVSPHSVAYKSPRREHTVQQCFVKRQQYYLSRPRPSNPLRIVSLCSLFSPAPSIPYQDKQPHLSQGTGAERLHLPARMSCGGRRENLPLGMPRGQSCPELTGKGVKVKPPVVEQKVCSQITRPGRRPQESSGISYKDSKYFRNMVASSFELKISPPKRLFTE